MEKIMYKNGGVDIDATVSQELSTIEELKQQNELLHEENLALEAFYEELYEQQDIPELTEALSELQKALLDGKYQVYLKDYGTEGLDEELKNRPLYFSEYAVSSDEQFARELADELFFPNSIFQYVSKITKDNKVIYSQDFPETFDKREFALFLAEKYGKELAVQYTRRALGLLRSKEKEDKIYLSEKTHLLSAVKELYEKSAPLVFPQNKNTLAEYLLRYATEPDMGEDCFSMGITYSEAVNLLAEADKGTPLNEIMAYIKGLEATTLVDIHELCLFLLNFGKEPGVQIYEERFIKPFEKEGNVTYLDYNIADIKKAKDYVEKIRQENAAFGSQFGS